MMDFENGRAYHSDSDDDASQTANVKLPMWFERISIKEPSMRYENKSFAFEISVLGKLAAEVAPVRTEGLFVCLFVVTDQSSVCLLRARCRPYSTKTWAARTDSCVEFSVSLRDYKNDIVRTRKVPLKAILMYENGGMAPDQSILRVVGDARQLSIETSSGYTVLKLRINEVSRSHQKQNFVIRICPDTMAHPLMNDIAPDQTSPIDVMSKPRPSKEGGGSSRGHGAASAGSGGHKRSAVEYDAGDDEEDGSNKAARIVGEWTLPSLG